MSQSAYQLGVAGNPIAHSLSPDIHQAFAASLGHDVVYQRYLFDREEFRDGAATFFQQGGVGLNVTVPFKRDAYQFADRLDGLAAAAGAVNTRALQDGDVVGYNTDGLGMVRDLQVRYGASLSGLNALILGAGGACRGIIQPLFDAGIGKICIANRTVANAQALVERFDQDYPDRIAAVNFDQLTDNLPEVQLIVNSTSTGLSQDLKQQRDAIGAAPEGLREAVTGPGRGSPVLRPQLRGASAFCALGSGTRCSTEAQMAWVCWWSRPLRVIGYGWAVARILSLCTRVCGAKRRKMCVQRRRR